jgi:hypothetical protein
VYGGRAGSTEWQDRESVHSANPALAAGGNGTESEEERDLRNERIRDLFILPILLWLQVKTAQCMEEEQDLRNGRIGNPFILPILLWLRVETALSRRKSGIYGMKG